MVNHIIDSGKAEDRVEGGSEDAKPADWSLSKQSLLWSMETDLKSDIRLCPQPQKFDNTGEDLEDLISIGTIGLIKAIESFQPNKGT